MEEKMKMSNRVRAEIIEISEFKGQPSINIKTENGRIMKYLTPWEVA